MLRAEKTERAEGSQPSARSRYLTFLLGRIFCTDAKTSIYTDAKNLNSFPSSLRSGPADASKPDKFPELPYLHR